MKEMILKTKRLLLRELKQDDFDDICKLLQDPIVMYAYEGAFSKKEVQEWLDKQLRRYQNDGFGLWGMIEKGSGELIGQCGLTYQEFNGQQVPEIGYLLRAEYWHKGYATEAAIACKEYAFNILNFDKVYSKYPLSKSSTKKRYEGNRKFHKTLSQYRYASFSILRG